MDTTSASNCSSGSMKQTAVVVIHHLRWLARSRSSRPFRAAHLTRIFMFHLLLLVKNSMITALFSNCDLGGIGTYCTSQNINLTLHPAGVPAFVVDLLWNIRAKIFIPIKSLPMRSLFNHPKLWNHPHRNVLFVLFEQKPRLLIPLNLKTMDQSQIWSSPMPLWLS